MKKMMNPRLMLVAVMLSVTVLGETMTIWQVFGGTLILGFTLWNEVAPKKQVSEKFTCDEEHHLIK